MTIFRLDRFWASPFGSDFNRPIDVGVRTIPVVAVVLVSILWVFNAWLHRETQR